MDDTRVGQALKSTKYGWERMKVGESFISEKRVSGVGNEWAEYNDLDWEFVSTKLGRRKYEIKRIK